MSERIVPEAVLHRPPRADQHARELYNLSSEWQSYKWEAKGEDPNGYLELTGGVFRERYTRGKRKGETHFGKPEPGTLMTLALPDRLQREWTAKWELETGFCSKCEGTGQQVFGWSSQTGTSYRNCPHCNASGKANVAGERAA